MHISKPLQTNTSQQQPDVHSILHAFFDQYTVDEFQKEIWNLMVAYCGQPDGSIPTENYRSNTSYFCANIDVLLKRLHRVWEQKVKEDAVQTDE